MMATPPKNCSSSPAPAMEGLALARSSTAAKRATLRRRQRKVVYATPGACARLTCGDRGESLPT